MFTTSLDLDSLQPIQDIFLSLENYSFDDKTRTIVKRKTKKRKMTHHEETTQEVVQLWNATHMNEEEFTKEVADALGDFSNANKWSVSKTIFSVKK
jgi:hypothetical protein